MTNAMPAGTAGGNPPAIEASGLVKTFGGVVALDGASFSANVGEVHALVGENGAGKSTLIKILGGRLRPDTGVVRYDGRPVVLRSPTEAHRLGAATVFQELTLFPGMTLAENLLIGREPRGALGLIDRRRTVVEASRILAELGLEDIDPAELVEDVSLAQRQIIEIVRAVLARPRIIFLDEPTSSLVEREVAWLFELVRRLRSEEPNFTVRLPEPVQQAVRLRAVTEKTTVRLVLLRALRAAGFEVAEEDMTDDRGIVAKQRSRERHG